MSNINTVTNTIFTEKELEDIKVHLPDCFVVRDGIVKSDTEVWWRSSEGPQRVGVLQHRVNIRQFPECYSIAEPKYTSHTVYNYKN
jgi:hypothetical protein